MSEELLAYIFYGHDNGSYAYAQAPACQCGKIILNKWRYIPLAGFLSNHSLDVSSTYDGALIASESIKTIYDQENWTGLDFRPLPGEPGFYRVTATQLFRFDCVRRKTRFEDKCSICGEYRQIAGSTPVFFTDSTEIPENGFARSDLEFGSNQEQHPIVICSPQVGQILQAKTLKGLDLVPIFHR